MGVPNPVFMIDWATYLSKYGGEVPKGGEQIAALRAMLQPELGGDDACLVSTYIGTGRSEANTSLAEWDTKTAEDDCKTDKWIGGRTVAQAFAAAKDRFSGAPGVYDALEGWGKGKAAKAIASVKANVKQDVDKLKKDAANVATGVIAAAGFGAVAYFFGAAIVVYLIAKASK